jgi:type I restriction enzyme S subunit
VTTESRWRTLPLDAIRAVGEGTLVGGPFGSELTQKDYVDAPGVPVIRGSNLDGKNNRFIDDNFAYVSASKADALRRNLAHPGDLVFTQRGTLGQVALIPAHARYERYVISQSQMKLTPNPDLADARYLYHFFRLPQSVERLLRHTQATGVPHINLAILKKFEVVLPPLAQQRRIAAILDKADALRAKRRAALAQLDTLTEFIFFDMFGDPATNPHDFPVARLGDLLTLKSGDFLPSAQMRAGSYPVFGGNGLSGFHDEYMFEAPQVVIGRVGVYCGSVHLSPPRTWITDNALYVRDREVALNDEYLYATLRFANLNQYASQSGQPLISTSRIAAVPLLVPPPAVQEDFARRVRRVSELRRCSTEASAGLEEAFRSIQHRAFRGEL